MIFSKINKKIIITIAVVLVVMVLVLTYENWSSPCAHWQIVNSSVTVRTIPNRAYFGMTTERDSLKFGGASPGTDVTRSIFVGYTKDTTVTIRMLGDLAPWTIIRPQKFESLPHNNTQVSFTVMVPSWAKDGNYTGKAEFCFSD